MIVKHQRLHWLWQPDSARFYALATQSYVISSTQIHTQEIYEGIGKPAPYEAFVEFGGEDACIIASNGKILTEKLPRNAEGLVYADIDLEKIVDCKYQIDPAGHYSNKTLSMTVNQSPKPVVTFVGQDTDCKIKYDDI